jgi:hypothetical protein
MAYAVFGGLTPVMVSLMIPLDKFAPVHYVVALCTVGGAIGVYLMQRDREAQSQE